MRLRFGSLATSLIVVFGSAAAPTSAGSAHLVADLNTCVELLPYNLSPDLVFFYSYTPVKGRVVFLPFFATSRYTLKTSSATYG
jgi:hypothetical protein